VARRTFPLRLPDDVYDAVKAMAFFTDRPMNDLILEAIRSYLAKQARSKLVRQMIADNDSRYRAALDTLFES
jgi:predicted transcriptional regulator